MTKDKERQHWRKNICEAEKLLGYANKTMPFRQKRRIDMFIEIAGIVEGVDVLELGCATGNFTLALAASKAHITAIDLSPDLLDVAKNRNFANNIEYKLADIDELPFADNSFDVVLGNSVLHHCDLTLALSQIKRVLRNNGKIIFSEPNMLNPHIFLQKNVGFLKRMAGDSPDETAFFRWNLRKALIQAGFKDIIIRPFDFLYPATPEPIINFVDRMGRGLERIPFIKEVAGSIMFYAVIKKNDKNG